MLACLAALATLCALSAGCAGYRFGSRSLYNPNIRTIYVPIVQNDTWRHDDNVRLTEALVKSIELHTPYKVVGDPNADSTLTCRLISTGKRTVSEAITDEPRGIEVLSTVQLTWLDRRGNLLFSNRFLPEGELAYSFSQATDFAPEGGQSISTAQQRNNERLAEQIVQQMELRW
ncbi:MAG: LPS assembly lipoprotein LptE [Aureliella sp.]